MLDIAKAKRFPVYFSTGAGPLQGYLSKGQAWGAQRLCVTGFFFT
jgi:hypothetical protein